MALESAAGNFETLKAMHTGAAALKAVRGNVDAETIEDIMDDLAEEKNLHDEISDAIARPGQDLFDDEGILFFSTQWFPLYNLFRIIVNNMHLITSFSNSIIQL